MSELQNVSLTQASLVGKLAQVVTDAVGTNNHEELEAWEGEGVTILEFADPDDESIVVQVTITRREAV